MLTIAGAFEAREAGVQLPLLIAKFPVGFREALDAASQTARAEKRRQREDAGERRNCRPNPL